ncbi:hypothetical protein QAD02_023886 [Eretmocerus hayati]|uniref:Uncharacterized protein n=1 Tax=Eretmocerus hayati TaxID=131215 RepID=A0ACC2PZ96_9HYME|nr:hypothetical protein QAD02_023886 [Eretmocerus hayati]
MAPKSSKEIKSGFTWVIPDWDFTVEVGHYISSPIFSTGHSDAFKWRLDIYPNGYKEDDFVSARLLHIQGAALNLYHVKLTIINQKGEDDLTLQATFFPYSRNPSRVFDRLVRVSCLAEPRNGLLADGKIILRCTIHPDSEMVTTGVKRCREFDDFEQLFDNGKFSDIRVVVGSSEFNLHKNILAARSEVFSAMFEHDMRESNENKVEITDFRPEVMKEAFRFIYSGTVNLKEAKGMECELLAVADKYKLDGLKEHCEDELSGSLTIDNVGEMLMLAHLHKAEKLTERAVKFTSMNAREVVRNQFFITMMKSFPSWLLGLIESLARN